METVTPVRTAVSPLRHHWSPAVACGRERAPPVIGDQRGPFGAQAGVYAASSMSADSSASSLSGVAHSIPQRVLPSNLTPWPGAFVTVT